MGGCATKENKENKPADDADGCVCLRPAFISAGWREIWTLCSISSFMKFLLAFHIHLSHFCAY